MATNIRNPIEWGMDQLGSAGRHAEDIGHTLHGEGEIAATELPTIGRLRKGDLRDALRRGWQDMQASRTDALFLCLIYPVAGIFAVYAALNYALLPLLFPIASGFALIGPVAAIGIYEMSRRREMGQDTSWADALGTIRSPAFGGILALGLLLFAIFIAWLGTAQMIYNATLGPEAPASIAAFAGDVVGTQAGWTMAAVGTGAGFLFALIVLTIGIVSFPMMLDRNIGVIGAMLTSMRVVQKNPLAAARWGIIVAGLLAIASIPAFLGHIVVMPLLGHATWHLYRKAVP